MVSRKSFPKFGAYFNNNFALDAYTVLLANQSKFDAGEVNYNYYVIFELRTILLNLSEMEQHKNLFKNGQEFSDEWLLECHKKAIETGTGVEEILLERVSKIDN